MRTSGVRLSGLLGLFGLFSRFGAEILDESGNDSRRFRKLAQLCPSAYSPNLYTV